MANAKTYNLDPNIFLPTGIAGVAQSPADRTAGAWAKILAATNSAGGGGYETIDTTASNIAVDVYETALAISGTMTATLPDPLYPKQRKFVYAKTAASSPALTLTVTTPDDTAGFVCAGTFVFDTVGQGVLFEATSALKWRAIKVNRAGGTADNVVIGTTVLTGYNLWKNYCCSVTATVSSTGTMALPNGSAIGERINVICTTAASTPVGSLDGVYTSGLQAAYTHAGAIGVVASATATGDMFLAEWTGSTWVVLYQNGITFS